MSKSEGLRKLLRPFRWYIAPRADGKSIILWWEKRRIAYNIFLFVFCLVPCLPADLGTFGWVITNPALQRIYRGNNETILLIQVVLQILSNVWYTGGWIAELIVKLIARRNISWFGPIALVAGTLFSFAFAAYFLVLGIGSPMPGGF